MPPPRVKPDLTRRDDHVSRSRRCSSQTWQQRSRSSSPATRSILAIPRGGVVTGAVLARELGGDLDVVLSRKLRAPGQPELAIGAISEDGQVHLNRRAVEALGVTDEYLEQEKQHQLSEIARRKRLFRSVRPEAAISGRTVIVTDDGIATGSTMMAALQTVRPQRPARTDRRRPGCAIRSSGGL